MQTKPDGAYRYICHTVDHFSKFHVVFPLPSKNAAVVAKEFKMTCVVLLWPAENYS